MVRIYPFNAFSSVEDGGLVLVDNVRVGPRANPNRYSVNTSYDRSVVIDRDSDEFSNELKVRKKIQDEADSTRQTPVVIISKVKNKEKDQDLSNNNICQQHGITFRNVREFIDGGILELVKEQGFLIYSQETRGGHRQVGICAALAVEDCLKGTIKRHEKVTKDASVSQKRFSNAPHPRNVDPVMMMYRQSDIIQSIVDRITSRESPVIMQARSRHNSRLGVDDDDSTAILTDTDDHRIWSISDKDEIEAIRSAFIDVDSLYIADGHHRTAAACRMALLNKGRQGSRAPSHSKYLLGFLYPHTHMRVIPYNRCVTGLGGRSPQEFLQLVSTVFRISDHDSGKRILGEKHCDGESCTEATSALPSPDWPILTSLSIPQTDSNGYSMGSPDKNIVRGLEVALDSDGESEMSSEVDELEESDMNADYDDVRSSRTTSESEQDVTRRLHDLVALEIELATVYRANDVAARGSRSALLALSERDREQENRRLIGHTLSHTITMYFEGRWLDLIPLEVVEEKEGDPLGSLDVQVLFERLLRPLLGIECPRTDHRMIYVCGSEGIAGLEARVNSQVATVAFRVGRVTVSDIMRVADAGQLMPPKATCFSPKPLSGLLVRLH